MMGGNGGGVGGGKEERGGMRRGRSCDRRQPLAVQPDAEMYDD